MNRQINSQHPEWNKKQGEGEKEKTEEVERAEKGRNQDNGEEEDEGRHLMGRERLPSGNTGVELKGGDILMKQSDRGDSAYIRSVSIPITGFI